MIDLAYILAGLLIFAACAGLLILCQRLMDE